MMWLFLHTTISAFQGQVVRVGSKHINIQPSIKAPFDVLLIKWGTSVSRSGSHHLHKVKVKPPAYPAWCFRLKLKRCRKMFWKEEHGRIAYI